MHRDCTYTSGEMHSLFSLHVSFFMDDRARARTICCIAIKFDEAIPSLFGGYYGILPAVFYRWEESKGSECMMRDLSKRSQSWILKNS